MVKEIDVTTWISNASSLPIIDVRTPAEFEKAHIPDAINLPLFSNEERVQVGTTYKRKSREDAILLGFDLVGPKWRKIIESALEKIPGKRICVHCWRGGMRSGVVSWVLDLYGFEVFQLKGGYKQYRRWALEQFDTIYPFLVVGGLTGSHKTDILHELDGIGEQVIDLEGLAQHQGSAFGSMNHLIQPTQEQFENNFAWILKDFDNNKPIWIEDESRTIGRIILPNNIWEQIRSSLLLKLKWSFEERVNYLLNEYGILNRQFLLDAVSQIQRRLGPQNYKIAIEYLENDNLRGFIEIILSYYDKAYGYGLDKRIPETIYEIGLEGNDMHGCAGKVLSFTKTKIVKNVLNGYEI
ncbi:MAG: tRNA 2-selenouridine(34) synthase MnmH [Chitinophagales bacterium]|nr:tRNA 2-selenouridine(34) synthase MnmH [Chitinophagales bacterium]